MKKDVLPPPLTSTDAALWQKACALREQYWKKNVFLRGIVEISNCCQQNCLYCGLRRDNTSLRRYRMEPDAIFAAARIVKRLGLGTIVLQAGEDPGFSPEDIARIVSRIKNELALAVTLSLGQWNPRVYTLWRKAGADRYLLKLETVNEKNYSLLRPGNTLAKRIRALHQLAALDYETGSGLITGLPGDTETTIVQGMELLGKHNPDMFSLSPFIPHPETPLKRCPAGDIAENLRAIAMARVMLPTAHIPVTSALGLQGDAMRLQVLEVADVLMASLTPQEVRKAYSIYPGKNLDEQAPEQRVTHFRSLLEVSGFTVPSGPGNAWRNQQTTTRES